VNFSLKAKLFDIIRRHPRYAPSIPESGFGRLFTFTPHNQRTNLCGLSRETGDNPLPKFSLTSVGIAIILLNLITSTVNGQERKPTRGQPIETKPNSQVNSLASPESPSKIDSLQKPTKQDSLKQDSLKQKKKGEIEYTIVYTAKDSINFSLDKKIVRLYGDAVVTYGNIQLDAELIVIDYEKSEITANGKPDSTGRLVGFPIFKEGNETYETREMVYNFKNRRAKISEVVTKQGEGFMHGQTVYKNDKNELFTVNNVYTTCDLKDPHFRVISSKAKAIPGDKIVSGPFYMEFNHVPTPLGFAFGMFPSPRKSSSGIIIPEYGEERTRGFFLRNMGYFFDINDYVKVTLLADLYSKGSTALKLNTNYNNRYKYSGSFNFSYTNNKLVDKEEDQSRSRDFSLTWSHSPRTKGTGRFSASVSAATTSFTRNNFLGAQNLANPTALNNTNRKLTSNISYSKTFANTPFALGINLRHSQDLFTGQVDLPMPDVTFNVNNLYPFKSISRTPILENMNIRYTMAGTNQITNNLGRIGKDPAKDSIASFNLANLGKFIDNGKNGLRHSIPVATSFKILKFFTVSPSISIDALTYTEKLQWKADSTGKTPVSTRVKGLNQVFNYSLSVGLTTRIYGTWLSKNPNSVIKGIRHLITPSISYSYTPDFSDPSQGYFQDVQVTDAAGQKRIIRKSVHEGFVYGTSRQGLSNTLGIGLGNTIEMKVKSKKDSVAKKISLFNNLSISTGYNFAADSFKLAPISMSANTNVLNNKINININATLDPYDYEVQRTAVRVPLESGTFTERRLDRLVWANGSLGRITSAGLAFSTNLNPKGQKSDTDTKDKIAKSNATQADKDYLLQNPQVYVDFSIPWNLRISYNINYTRTASPSAILAERAVSRSQLTQALNFSGDLSLTTKWKIGFNSGYDFVSNQFTQTNLSINRDIHCWQLSLNWVPFGQFQSYLFNIGVKSALLRDLKLNRTRSFFDVR
jgi:lipopolysaccharide assembly outer membrane protein LptD (OstA)